MSVSSETIDYYEELIGIGRGEIEQLCEPQQLAVLQNGSKGISVRDVHDTHPSRLTDRPNPFLLVESGARSYMAKLVRPMLKSVEAKAPETVIDFGDTEFIDTGLRGSTLVDTKIKTGFLTELAVQAVAPSELPFQFRCQPSQHPLINSEAAFFMFSGAVQLGGYSGTVASGVMIRPEIGSQGFLSTKTNARRFSDKQVSALQQWQLGIDAARARQASAMQNPISGGLPGSGKR